jgi:hypothetical protein
MKTLRWSLLSLLLLTPLCIAESAPVLPGDGIGVNINQPAEKVLRAGAWELQIWYRAKGTRSEGQHGVLLRDGKIVKGSTVDEEVDTALGKMKYYGTQPSVLWNPSRWLFADKSLMKPSSFCP